MLQPPRFFNHYSLWIELIYSLIVIISCLLIYFRTKELYALTSHKGIKYFRDTFLFFGITFAVRFFLRLIIALRLDTFTRGHFPFGIFELAFFIMIYASSMALIYLMCSIFWKKLNKNANTFLFNSISLLVALASITLRIPLVFLVFQSMLFLFLLAIGYSNYKKAGHDKNFSQMYFTYLLIFVLWLVSNVLEFVVHFSPAFGLITYVISIILFLAILHKVLAKVKYK